MFPNLTIFVEVELAENCYSVFVFWADVPMYLTCKLHRLYILTFNLFKTLYTSNLDIRIISHNRTVEIYRRYKKLNTVSLFTSTTYPVCCEGPKHNCGWRFCASSQMSGRRRKATTIAAMAPAWYGQLKKIQIYRYNGR